MVPELRQNEEQNAKQYAESQKQRGMEREFRRARIDYKVAKEQGADKDELKKLQGKIKDIDQRLDRFVDETGRKRRREREYAPVNATWPKPTTESPTAVRDALRDYFMGQ